MKPSDCLALTAGLGALVIPSVASAECHTTNFGLIHSETWGRARASGNGVELSFMSWPGCSTGNLLGVGAFAQGEIFDFSHSRFAGGVQLGHMLGIEAGYALRTASGDYSLGHGPHLSAFLSLGFVSIAFRNSLYFDAGSGRSYGYEPSLVLGIKMPIPDRMFTTGEPIIHNLNWRGFGGSHQGRPRRDALGRALLPRARVLSAGAPKRTALGVATRTRRAEAWLADARAEHASVPAFVELGAALLLGGAPAALAERCFGAAVEEMHHTRICLALATRWSGDRYEIGGAAPRAIRRRSRRALARESIIDGVVGEGVAAALAREALTRADDEDEAAVLATIARDEAGHARLARDIARWAQDDADEADSAARDLTVRYDLAMTGSAAELVSARRGREIGRAVLERIR